ncbi:COPA1 protein, partial [Polyodon spathula]|nr:COPA1 protein [Polyodon spathula]
MTAAAKKDDPRRSEDMESKAGSNAQRCCSRTFPNVLSCMFSLLCVAYCILLSVRTSEFQDRVYALETGQGELYDHHRAPAFSVDQLNSMVQERVDELLAQRSYEHLAKIRIAREAPPECSCPAGKKQFSTETYARYKMARRHRRWIHQILNSV